ncbi:MAG: arsC [Myxococcaceae bacterium]|nr:arsC [Myxococcaceae bacterium]
MSKPTSARMYHNPRCSKSRETLALLEQHHVEVELVEYLKTPPSAREVKALIAKLGVAPHALLRFKEAAYQTLGLSSASSLDAIAKAIAEEPSLLERPIVVVGDKAVIARPPESVLALLPTR